MLKTWQVSNFKSIREMGEPVEFAPLTIFCGTNSSGKSSLLQSILLFKQTLEKKEIQGPRMALNGGLVKLGNFDDIVTNGLSEDNDKKIKCTFQIDNPKIGFDQILREICNSDIGIEKIEHFDEEIDEIDIADSLTSKRQGEKELRETVKKDPPEGFKIEDAIACVDKITIFPLTDKPPVECCICFGFSKKDWGKDLRFPYITSIKVTNPQKNKILIDCEYREDISSYVIKGEEAFLSQYDEDKTRWLEEYYKRKPVVKNLTFDYFFPILDSYYDLISYYDLDFLMDTIVEKTNYKYSKNSITNFFSNSLYYVGPLRADPKEGNNTTSQYKGVGYRGEYTSEYFTLHDDFQNYFFEYNSGAEDHGFIITEKLQDLIVNKTMKEKPFKLEVYEWCRYIGVADEVDTNNDGELIVKQGNGRWSSLKNVGVGVSQVLPIIIQCIVAEPGSTIILEQPELHLHPKMQSRLADFFLVMSLLGKQIIIETHSEYIIDKLRLRIAQAPSDAPINDKVAVYFAEKKNDNSEFRRIHINEYSVMSEWPEGFFEDSMQIARGIMLAAEEKKLKNSSTTDEEDDDDY